MDPASVNAFLDQFLAAAGSGFGLIRGDVGFVLNALIAISITLAGLQWVLAGEAPLAGFFRKVLFVGFFAFLVNNWAFLSDAVAHSGALLGLRAGGGEITLADLHNPGRVAGIGVELFGRMITQTEGLNIITDFVALATVYLAALFVMLGFFVLALQLFVSLIAFKLGALAAFVALPWGVFSGTAWVAERPLGWVAGSAIRLFVLAFVASISLTFATTLPARFDLEDGGALNVLLFGLTVMALAWFAPQLASEVVQGQPHLSGNDALRAGAGAAVTAVGAGLAVGYGARAGLRQVNRLVFSARDGRSPGMGAGRTRAPRIDYAAMEARPRGDGFGATGDKS
jgi:type IV secretion system protein TrbL